MHILREKRQTRRTRNRSCGVRHGGRSFYNCTRAPLHFAILCALLVARLWEKSRDLCLKNARNPWEVAQCDHSARGELKGNMQPPHMSVLRARRADWRPTQSMAALLNLDTRLISQYVLCAGTRSVVNVSLKPVSSDMFPTSTSSEVLLALVCHLEKGAQLCMSKFLKPQKRATKKRPQTLRPEKC